MEKDELIELVRKIIECEGAENEQDKLIELLETNVLDPQISDYIFFDDLTPEEIIDKALKYKCIIL